jgi:DamX protein
MIPQDEPRRSNLPVFHIVAISAVIAVAGVFYLYLDDKEPEKNLTVQAVSSAPVISTQSSVASVSRSTALTNTQTPVQPILQSLPNTTVVQNSDEVLPNNPVAVSGESTTKIPTPVTDIKTSEIKINEVAVNQVPVTGGAVTEVSSSTPEETVKNNPPSASTQNVSHLTEHKPAKPAELSGNYTAQEKKILAWSPSQFTIQLLGVSSLKSAQEFVSSQSNKSELLIFKTKRSGKDWFVVVTGHYASNAQARTAINSLPAQQRDAGPWPRQIQIIQNEIRQ